MNHEEATVCRRKQLAITEKAVAILEVIIHTFSIQLCRLQSAHSFKDLVFSGKIPLAAHLMSSLLVRGPKCCGGFCRCVVGLFKKKYANMAALSRSARASHNILLKVGSESLIGLMALGVGSHCLIQHSTSPRTVSATRPPPLWHKSHKGNQVIHM